MHKEKQVRIVIKQCFIFRFVFTKPLHSTLIACVTWYDACLLFDYPKHKKMSLFTHTQVILNFIIGKKIEKIFENSSHPKKWMPVQQKKKKTEALFAAARRWVNGRMFGWTIPLN